MRGHRDLRPVYATGDGATTRVDLDTLDGEVEAIGIRVERLERRLEAMAWAFACNVVLLAIAIVLLCNDGGGKPWP